MMELHLKICGAHGYLSQKGSWPLGKRVGKILGGCPEALLLCLEKAQRV